MYKNKGNKNYFYKKIEKNLYYLKITIRFGTKIFTL